MEKLWDMRSLKGRSRMELVELSKFIPYWKFCEMGIRFGLFKHIFKINFFL